MSSNPPPRSRRRAAPARPVPSGNGDIPAIDPPIRPGSERLFRALMDHSWDRVALVDARGIIRYSSPSSFRIHQYTSDELVGRNAFDFVHPEDLTRALNLFNKLVATPGFKSRMEYRARRKDGQYIWMETTVRSLLHDPWIRAIILNERDITERKRVDSALRATLECGEAMIRATSEPELLEVICDSIVRMGSYRMAWVGFPQKDGKKQMIPVARAGAGQDYVDKARITWAPGVPRGAGPVGLAMRTRKTVAWHDLARDPRFAPWRREAVRRGYASIIALPLLWRTESLGVLAIYSDQSFAFQREEAELLENLAADIAFGLTMLRTRAEHDRLQHELLEISEREQRRIAQDLHDGLCQQLLGTSWQLGAVQRRLAQRGDPEAAALLRISKTVAASAVDARALAHGAHPVGPGPRALMAALRDFAVLTSRVFNVECTFQCPRAVLVRHQSTAGHLYRIAQEAAGNAIKHGAAKHIVIRLRAVKQSPGNSSRGKKQRILLTIRDDGDGLPPQLPADGMGLQIMRHRAAICHGTLTLRKSAPRGTLVTCDFPPGPCT